MAGFNKTDKVANKLVKQYSKELLIYIYIYLSTAPKRLDKLIRFLNVMILVWRNN